MDTKKKVIITTATVAAAVTTGAVATTAHADATTNTENTNAQTQTSQSDLKTAQDRSRQNYADAKTADSQAQTDVANAQKAVTNAENNQTAASAQAGQDAVAQQNAQEAINQASDALKQAQDTASKTSTDPQAVSKAQQAVNDAKTANDQAQRDLQSATTNVNNAQKQDDQAKYGLDQAQKAIDTAQGDVDQFTTDVNNAQNHQVSASNTVNQAQQAKSTADKDVAKATTDVNNAQSAVNDAQNKVTNANNNVNTEQSALTAAQQNLYNLQKYSVKESIKVSTEWVNTIKSYLAAHPNDWNQMFSENSTSSDESAFAKQLAALGKPLLSENKYIPDPELAKIQVHLTSAGTLDSQTELEVTRYAANLLNSIRHQLGVSEYQITQQALDDSTNIAAQYVKDNWTLFNHGNHDFLALFKNHQDGESLSDGYIYFDNDTASLDQIHEAIYYSITSMLFDDKDSFWGHMTDLAGLRGELNGIYLGVQLDRNGQVHFNGNNQQTDGSEVSENINGHVYTAIQHRDNSKRIPINPTPSELTSYKKAVSDAQAALAVAKSAQQTAQSALSAAQDQLNGAKSALSTAQAKQKDATTKLNNANSALNTANQAVTAAQNKLATAKSNAKKAQDTLTMAQTTKTNADRTLSNAQSKLAGAKTQANNTAVALKQANDKLNAVLGANKAVESAQAKLDQANEALQVAKSNSQTSAKKLADAQAAVKVAQDNLAKAQEHAKETAQALADAKAKLITDAKLYHDSVSIKSVTIHKGESVPAPEIANPMATDPTQSQVMGAYLALAASKLDTIPTGTTAAWSNLDQLNADSQLVGTHQEGATVTFPDGSTMTLSVPLTVLEAETPVTPVTPVTPSKPDDHDKTDDHKGDNSHTTTPTTPTDHSKNVNTTLPSDAHIVNNQVVNAQGQVIPSYKVENGKIIAENTSANAVSVSATTPVASATTMTREQYRQAQSKNTLPQTGNANESGLIALGFTTLAAMFGLVAKRRNN